MVPVDLPSLTTEELEKLIAAASAERAKRQPIVPMDQPKTFEAIIDPRWSVTSADANTILQLRHPGLGWVSFLLPPNERAHLLSVFLHFALLSTARREAAPAPVPVPTSGGGTVH